MRYSKWALLLFGAGMVFGLAVVSLPLPQYARAASAAMAAGIALLPVALYADWRRRSTRPNRRPRKSTARRRATPRRRPANRAKR